jgi:phage terminase large subunit-like protein
MVRIFRFPKFPSLAARELERRIIDRTIMHEGPPIMRVCVASAAVKTKSYDLLQLIKPSRLKAAKRIDGVSALLTAMARAVINEETVVKPSVYESRALMVLSVYKAAGEASIKNTAHPLHWILHDQPNRAIGLTAPGKR